MRTLALGLVLGLLLGSTVQAGAQYLQDGTWFRLDRRAQTAYVAGVSDALESITNFADRAGADRAIDRVRLAARCTGQVPPSRLAELGDRAIERAPRYAPPSTAIIVRLVACGGKPNLRSPDRQPNYAPAPYNNGWNDNRGSNR